jgi:hypothetical protein
LAALSGLPLACGGSYSVGSSVDEGSGGDPGNAGPNVAGAAGETGAEPSGPYTYTFDPQLTPNAWGCEGCTETSATVNGVALRYIGSTFLPEMVFWVRLPKPTDLSGARIDADVANISKQAWGWRALSLKLFVESESEGRGHQAFGVERFLESEDLVRFSLEAEHPAPLASTGYDVQRVVKLGIVASPAGASSGDESMAFLLRSFRVVPAN